MKNEKKLYITYEQIHNLVKKVASEIIEDQFNPDFIVGIASGGFMPSLILKNFLHKDVLIVGLKRYSDDKIAHELPVKIQWIDEIENKLENKKILLVDEIDDTRVTLNYCLNELLKYKIKEIRVAVIHKKIKEKKADFPDEIKKIYIGEEIPDEWVIYPWTALDIAEHYRLCGINK
jgi:hypoxanthine phosphoribosyltransferase